MCNSQAANEQTPEYEPEIENIQFINFSNNCTPRGKNQSV